MIAGAGSPPGAIFEKVVEEEVVVPCVVKNIGSRLIIFTGNNTLEKMGLTVEPVQLCLNLIECPMHCEIPRVQQNITIR